MSPYPTMCNTPFREGDIMKAKPKHFIPRPEGSVRSTEINSINVTQHLQHIREVLANILWLSSVVRTHRDL